MLIPVHWYSNQLKVSKLSNQSNLSKVSNQSKVSKVSKIYQRSRAKGLHTKTQRRAAAFVISWSRSQLFSDHCALMFTPLLVIVDTAVRKPIPCVLYVVFEPLLVIVPSVRKTTQQDIASLLN